jgi:hypothetical protein
MLRNRPAAGFFVLLGKPVAHEGHPHVRFALRSLRVMISAVVAGALKAWRRGIEIRIGINPRDALSNLQERKIQRGVSALCLNVSANLRLENTNDQRRHY